MTEAKEIERAAALIRLGARIQVLEALTHLSLDRLRSLYLEVTGSRPSRSHTQLTADWYLTQPANAHSSLFLNIHEYLDKALVMDEPDLLIKSYGLYQEQVQALGLEAALSVTRAWRLLGFVNARALQIAECTRCQGKFVATPMARSTQFVCGLCSAHRSGEQQDSAASVLRGVRLP